MKKYMLFAYDNYYPCGGMSDFKSTFDTLEETIKYCKTKKDYYDTIIKANDHCYIYEVETLKLVWENHNDWEDDEE